MIKEAISFKEFEREFKTNVAAPIVKALEKASKKEASKGAFDSLVVAIQNDLPTQLYGWITQAETSVRPGEEKHVGVMTKFMTFIKGLGYAKMAGILAPFVNKAIIIIYRRYFEEWFDQNGLEDDLEMLLGFAVGTPTAPAAGSGGGSAAAAAVKTG